MVGTAETWDCVRTSLVAVVQGSRSRRRERVAMQPSWFVTVVLLGFAFEGTSGADDTKLKLADCPEAVKKTLQAEAAGAKIETVTRQKDEDDEVVFSADVVIGGKNYTIDVLENGTLSEIILAIEGDEEVPFDRSPANTQATFKAEAFGVKILTLSKDLKYGVPIYEAVVEHHGKKYEIVVAEDGTLVEKVLVIDDEEVELSACPALVQTSLKKYAKGGTIDGITRSTGIGKHTYEAEVEFKGKVYLIEVDEGGLLISKSLQASEE
jgi:hypothetical protein